MMVLRLRRSLRRTTTAGADPAAPDSDNCDRPARDGTFDSKDCS